VKFSFLDQDRRDETTAWNRSEDPPLPDYLDQIADKYFEDVEEEERVRARERIEQVSKPIKPIKPMQCRY